MKRLFLLTAAVLLTATATFAQGNRDYGPRGNDDVYSNGRNDGWRGNDNRGYGGPGSNGCGPNGGRSYGYGNGYGDPNNRYDNIDERQYVQQSRIYRGLRDGSLNRWEAQCLQRELARLEGMEARFRRNDGRLDGRERRILDDELDRLAWNVRRERSDWARR